jgi:DNA-binding CsgD family transcriptional regulator
VSVWPGGAAGRLLEREVELARVDLACHRAGAGSGTAVVVDGPAGIGKSELLAAVRAEGQARGFGVLAAGGSEFESEIPFGIARQLFEPMLGTASPAERRRLLDGVAHVGGRAVGMEAGEAPADRFAAIHGLYWLLANRADHGPLVVSVDDVQWADDPSLAWLGYVARRVEDLRLLLVVGLRSGDPGAERRELAGLVEDRRVEHLVLGPLSASAVGAIVREQLDEQAEEGFCAACSELTGGNPLFVRELMAAASEGGLAAREEYVSALERIAPAAVGTSVLGRLARLGPEAVALARAVAVLGAGAEVVLAARLAELDPTVAELTADRLAAAQILAPVRPLEFFHPVIGAAILEDVAPGARRVAHRRAAELVDSDGKGSLARVAAHLIACGPAGDEWVVQRLRDAAREALECGAPGAAASYLRRALSDPPTADERPALYLLLGTAEWHAGQPDAISHLEETVAEASPDPGIVIAACGLLALAYAVSDRADRAVGAGERALAAIADTGAAELAGDRTGTDEPSIGAGSRALALEAVVAMVGMLDERTSGVAMRRAERLRARLDTLPEPPVGLLVMLGYYAARMNRADEAQALAERALASDPYPPPFGVCPMLIITLAQIECYDALQRLCADLFAAARRRGAMRELVGVSAFRARASYDRGALADAEADARWALERTDGTFRMPAALELVRVLIERDELDAAGETIEELIDTHASPSVNAGRLLLERGRLRAARGEPRGALDDFLQCGERYARLGAAESSTPWRGEAALMYAQLGHPGEARRLADQQLELARASGRRRALGVSLRVSGLVQGGEAGLALLKEAISTLERSESPLELARALSDHGAMLRRAGQRVQARVELEQALDLAHRCGARRIANRARAELIAAGAKPRRDAITGRDALTAGELRVARLAADGLTNREIAQALFITTKTAKAHLNRVYRKLGISRRGQLARALTAVMDDGTEGSTVGVTAIS